MIYRTLWFGLACTSLALPSPALGQTVAPGGAATLPSDLTRYLESGRSPVDARLEPLCPNPRHVAAVRLAGGVTVYGISKQGRYRRQCGLEPIVVVVADGHGGYRPILSDKGESLQLFPNGRAIVEYDAPGDPLKFRRIYSYDGNDYAMVADDWVFYPTGEEKARVNDIHFAGGASSATVAGKAYATFFDRYRVVAEAGQVMSITVKPSSGKIDSIFIYPSSRANAFQDAHGLSWRGTLAASGAWEIRVVGASDVKPTTYSMQVTIH